MIIGKFARTATALALVSLAATPALADKASQLTSLNGKSPDTVEAGLSSRGFTYVASNTNSMNYTYSYWWDAGDKSCVNVEAHDGTVVSISDASAADCHHGGDSKAAAAVGVVAGAAILGALLSHKSNHHENGQHSADAAAEQQYERGFNDGLHNAAYHNYDRNDSYSSGYGAGVAQRSANLGGHSGRGGYSAFVNFDDLNGARAAGGMDELTRRGFTQVDNFTSGNTRYSIQYRPASRQCVQVTLADGKFYDVRDIGTHPKCR